jgi:membrane-bound metal-dependent hydrolase YbcI (DUF457 family)
MKGHARRVLIDFLAFFLLLNLMVTVTVVILHETGHAFVGTFMGCSNAEVFITFPMVTVTTELICPSGVEGIIAFGAFLFAVPFSLAFMLLGRLPERRLVWIALGLIIFTASQDMVTITGFQLLFPFSLFVGLGLILYGEDELIMGMRSMMEKIFKGILTSYI